MRLDEFLLARIAEDEATARRANKSHRMTIEEPLHQPGRDILEAIIALTDERRVLAECEAKRRIVALCTAIALPVGGAAYLRDDILRVLALPYADHPDYREEWRV
jgi:hypothetical protein